MDMASATKIHEASLALLSNPGIRIEHDMVVDLLRKAGARVSPNSQVVSFPRELVMECVERAPREVSFADRRQGSGLVTPDGKSQIWSAPGLNILRHGKHRPFIRSDMADMTRLVDRLPEVDGIFSNEFERDPRSGHPFRIGLLAEQAGRFSRDELRACQSSAIRAHEQLVSSRLPDAMTLELMLTNMLA